tara:strand:- start:425 stop:1219 length:795 start_codon:yes stop_codon:yes gene_type:complete
MSGKVVIKLGGGLITDKGSMKTINTEAVRSVAKYVAEITDLGFAVLLVHGAGSYGHILAKKWSIASGSRRSILESQREAVSRIRKDMIELNSIVIGCLEEQGLQCESLPPSNWAMGTGKEFSGNLTIFENEKGVIPVTFGDVVDTNDGTEFGILSGDDIMLRLSNEMVGVGHAIFLIGDAPGIMDRPPNQDGAILLETWGPNDSVNSEHHEEIDVTGGIRLKMERASEISRNVQNVWIIDGRQPSRLLELLTRGQTIGTRIMPS